MTKPYKYLQDFKTKNYALDLYIYVVVMYNVPGRGLMKEIDRVIQLTVKNHA